MSDPTIITRFAPSPTGALHIGGARTALYNWAFARQAGEQGRFILRMEDTDQKRSSRESTLGILRDLQWLGLDWDEGPPEDLSLDPYDLTSQRGDNGPYFQSQRLEIYQQHIERLLSEGRAYEDDGAVRFKQDRDIAFDDMVYGHIAWKADDLEDFVIRKTDGFPTYHFAVVVDDHLMGVTHVIRGQEHTTNTAKHCALFDAFGWDRPVFAHTPSIMNPDGSKMSKRDKAKAARAAWKNLDDATRSEITLPVTAEGLEAFISGDNDDIAIARAIGDALDLTLPEIEVDDFRRSGYLPQVLLNYVALLGWNPGNDVERFDLDELVRDFSLTRVNKANAKFDRTKLLAFNQDTIAELPPEGFAHELRQQAQVGGHVKFDPQLPDNHITDAWFAKFAEAYQPRAKTLEDPFETGTFLVADASNIPYNLDDKGVKKALLKGDEGNRGVDGLRAFLPVLEKVEPSEDWGTRVHDAMQQFCEQHGWNMGKVAQPIRVAVAGVPVTPPMDVTLDLLGREETLRRIQTLLALPALRQNPQ